MSFVFVHAVLEGIGVVSPTFLGPREQRHAAGCRRTVSVRRRTGLRSTNSTPVMRRSSARVAVYSARISSETPWCSAGTSRRIWRRSRGHRSLCR
jgi:hypothetical protein